MGGSLFKVQRIVPVHNPRSLGYGWSFNSLGSLRPSTTTYGTTVTAGAAETKGATTQIISSANVARDVFFIEITAVNGSAAAALGNMLLDIMADPAGGTAWSVIIPNLLLCGVSNLTNGCMYTYRFPLWIKSGSSIGARIACSTASRATSIGIRVLGSPHDRRNVGVGTRVVSYGVVSATSQGTAVTQGTTSEGSWTQLGTVSGSDLPWYWQVGASIRNTVAALQVVGCDLGIGDATNKYTVVENAILWSDTSERVALRRSLVPPVSPSKSGDIVYGRAQNSGASQADFTMAAYGVTG